MKKVVLIIVMFLAIGYLSNIAFAGFVSDEADLRTRLLVSTDETTWLNYDAESNPSNQTLTVSPGDRIFLRLKTWNVGTIEAQDVQFSAIFSNLSYFESFDAFSGSDADCDGDNNYYDYEDFDSGAGVFQFSLESALGNTTEDTGFQSGQIQMVVAENAPDQAEVSVTVQIDSTAIVIGWLNKLAPKALADENATTQIRILVSNPTVTQEAPQDDPVYTSGKGSST